MRKLPTRLPKVDYANLDPIARYFRDFYHKAVHDGVYCNTRKFKYRKVDLDANHFVTQLLAWMIFDWPDADAWADDQDAWNWHNIDGRYRYDLQKGIIACVDPYSPHFCIDLSGVNDETKSEIALIKSLYKRQEPYFICVNPDIIRVNHSHGCPQNESTNLMSPLYRGPAQWGYINENHVQDVLRCICCDTYWKNIPKTDSGRAVRMLTNGASRQYKKSRVKVLTRDTYCEICNTAFNDKLGKQKHCGHIVSRKDAINLGMLESCIDHEDNMAAMCSECNSSLSSTSLKRDWYIRFCDKKGIDKNGPVAREVLRIMDLA